MENIKKINKYDRGKVKISFWVDPITLQVIDDTAEKYDRKRGPFFIHAAKIYAGLLNGTIDANIIKVISKGDKNE